MLPDLARMMRCPPPGSPRPPSSASRQAARRTGSCSLARRTLLARDPEPADRARHRRHAHPRVMGTGPVPAVLRQRRIGMPGDLRPERAGLVRPECGRPSRTWQRGHAAGGVLPLAPANDGAGADAKGAGGLGLAEPGVDGAQQPLAEVDRLLLHPARVPSTPTDV
jgi:hypothetical protein